MVELRHLHLDLALGGHRPAGEDGQDDLGAVQHRHAPRLLQVALLARGQLVVDEHRRVAHLGEVGRHRLHRATPEEGRRVGLADRDRAALDDGGAQRAGELLHLVQLDLGALPAVPPAVGTDDVDVVQGLADAGVGAGVALRRGHAGLPYRQRPDNRCHLRVATPTVHHGVRCAMTRRSPVTGTRRGPRRCRRGVCAWPLIAHDGKKADMLAFATFNRGTLAHFQLVATATTGRLLREKVGLDVEVPAVRPHRRRRADRQPGGRGPGRRGDLPRRPARQASPRPGHPDAAAHLQRPRRPAGDERRHRRHGDQLALPREARADRLADRHRPTPAGRAPSPGQGCGASWSGASSTEPSRPG